MPVECGGKQVEAPRGSLSMKLHSNIFGWEYVWEEFADDKGGTAIRDGHDNESAGKLLGLEILHQELEAVISVIPTNKGTMLKAGFRAADDFKLHLLVEHLIHRFEKVFGMPDIRVGDHRFDSRYVIRSNSAEKIKQIFDEASLRESILECGIGEIKIIPAGSATTQNGEVAPGHSVLTCNFDASLEKYEQLNTVYEAFVLLLKRLKQCGVIHQESAAAEPPDLPPVAPTVPMRRLHSPLLDR